MTMEEKHEPAGDEWFDVLDDTGEVIGRASRGECHRKTFLLHPVVHVLVFRKDGRLLLQKRAGNKDIQPWKWDTSVGGHLAAGETVEHGVMRETEEELGIRGAEFEELYCYTMTTDVERERVTTFRCVWEGPVRFPPDEIEDVREFTPEEINSLLGTGFFTPNFEEEWQRYLTFARGIPPE